MRIEDVKRWHWILIALVVGVALGYVRIRLMDDGPPSGRITTSTWRFEVALHEQRLRDIAFYRCGDAWVVDMQMADANESGSAYEPRQLYQRTLPYQPQIPPEGAMLGIIAWRRGNHSFKPPRSDYSVIDYLQDVAKRNSKITFRHAWWKETNATMLFWTLGSVVVIGGIWPTFVNVLSGAGFGRPKKQEPAYDLDRFKSEEPSATAAQEGPSPEEDAMLKSRLEALEREVEANLSAASASPQPQATEPAKPPAPAAVPALNASPLEVDAAPAAANDEKDYRGEFYPVARPSGGKHEDESSS